MWPTDFSCKKFDDEDLFISADLRLDCVMALEILILKSWRRISWSPGQLVCWSRCVWGQMRAWGQLKAWSSACNQLKIQNKIRDTGFSFAASSAKNTFRGSYSWRSRMIHCLRDSCRGQLQNLSNISITQNVDVIQQFSSNSFCNSMLLQDGPRYQNLAVLKPLEKLCMCVVVPRTTRLGRYGDSLPLFYGSSEWPRKFYWIGPIFLGNDRWKQFMTTAIGDGLCASDSHSSNHYAGNLFTYRNGNSW